MAAFININPDICPASFAVPFPFFQIINISSLKTCHSLICLFL
jgi:hypothetical protein